LEDRHDLLVRSVAVLLHPGADSPQLTGTIERAFPGEAPYSFLRYGVVRVWQIPVQQLLDGGLGTLALAPIGDVPPSELPGVIQRMERRLRRRPESLAVGRVWLARRPFQPLANFLQRGYLASVCLSATFFQQAAKRRVGGGESLQKIRILGANGNQLKSRLPLHRNDHRRGLAILGIAFQMGPGLFQINYCHAR
jgi:hypothetical protein